MERTRHLNRSETDGGGNRTPERSPDSPLTEEQPNTEVAPSAAPVGEPSEKDGSFSVPAEQPTRHFTDAEVRRNYEYILTSTNLYPSELHSAVRSVLSEPPLNPDWSDKGRQIAALFTPMATVNIRAIFSIVPGYMVRMAFHFSLMKAIPTFPGTGWRFYWTP